MGGTASASPASGTAGTEITLTATPASGYHFKEWQVISGGVTVSDDKFTMPASDVELQAVFEADAPNTYKVTGVVQDYQNNPLNGATVTLMQGNKICGTTTTNRSGQYAFTNVPVGIYNIVAKHNGVTMTVLVAITNANVDAGTITMPEGTVNSKLEVKDEGGVTTPDVVVDGLQKEATAIKTDAGSASEVTVTMTVKAEAENTNDTNQTAIKQAASAQQLDQVEFLSITVTKTVTTTGNPANTTTLDATKTVLELIVPYSLTDKHNIGIYRHHAGRAESFTALDSKPDEQSKMDKTFWIDTANELIHIYTNQFSNYAIAYSDTPVVTPTPNPTPSGSDYTPTYAITVEKAEHGTVKANRSYASSGSTVTITVTPEDGYVLAELTVTDSQGNSIEVTDKGNGTYTVKMPSRKVMVKASFVMDSSFSVCPGDNTCPMWSYSDAETTAWYHDGVHYCIENGLMSGYGNGILNPNADTTRAMVAVMLWKLNDSPVVNDLLDFEDVEEGQWYTEAIRWAKSEGIATGYGNGCFGTNDAVTREQMVTILWHYAQYKGIDVSAGENTNILSYHDVFDVAEYAIPAMQWACGSGMIQGKDAPAGEGLILHPKNNGTRAEIAAVLQQFCVNVLK